MNYHNVDEIVEKQMKRGVDVRWDGWDLIYFNPDQSAYFKTTGRFRNGQWGFETRLTPNRNGDWTLSG